jgi:4-amino-4-deoxy-L-arabinose transferase-like glycosyltransferase
MGMIKKLVKHKSTPKIVLGFILLIFVVFSLYLALDIKMGVSPDSYYHLEVSQAYSKTLGIPENAPETYKWTDITRIPYLSFWLNGRILNLNEVTFNFDPVILLRIFNIITSLGTLIFVYLISKEIIKNKWGKILPVFLLSNTLMFVFLSSSINYDNLTILFCTISLYFLIKYLKSPKELKNSLPLWIFLSLGSLTKLSVLPLAFIVVLVWAFVLFKKKILGREYLKQLFNFPNILYLVLLAILLFLNLNLYGVNILKYGKLTPSCLQMLTYEQCLENGVFYRNEYKIPKVFEGNIFEAINLVITRQRIGPLLYMPYWIVEMSKKIFGIMGDRSMFMPYEYLPPYFLYFFLGIFLIIKHRKKWKVIDKALIVISLFYVFILMYYNTYRSYITHNWMDLALQGRYIFPVLPIMYILFSKYFLKIKNKKLLNILIVVLVVLFLLGSIGYFFAYVPSDWFM